MGRKRCDTETIVDGLADAVTESRKQPTPASRTPNPGARESVAGAGLVRAAGLSGKRSDAAGDRPPRDASIVHSWRVFFSFTFPLSAWISSNTTGSKWLGSPAADASSLEIREDEISVRVATRATPGKRGIGQGFESNRRDATDCRSGLDLVCLLPRVRSGRQQGAPVRPRIENRSVVVRTEAGEGASTNRATAGRLVPTPFVAAPIRAWTRRDAA